MGLYGVSFLFLFPAEGSLVDDDDVVLRLDCFWNQ